MSLSSIQPVCMVSTVNGSFSMASAFPENNPQLVGYLDGIHDRKSGLPPTREGTGLYLLGYYQGYRKENA